MFFHGILIGFIAFVVIGIFHPIVIYGEYYFGIKIWPVFLAVGILLGILSLFITNIIVSSLLGIVSFSCFWSIHELFRQCERVERGWFPKNPHKKIKKIRKNT
jgi:hypothetical protein